MAHEPPKEAPQQVSKIDAYRDEVKKMVGRGSGPQAIYDKLRLDHEDFKGSLSGVKRFVLRLKKERGVKPTDVAIPVTTLPGEVLQVDFGYVGMLYDPQEGRLRKTWAFVAVLGHSRHMVVRLVFDQKTTTWLTLHDEVFRELGGVPKVVVPDNLKAAVVRAAFGVDDEVTLNRSYRELARFFGCVIDPTPVRSPEKKGKVESGVKYVKRNFFLPRGEMDIDEARRELARWLTEIAGQRIHGTTGRRPAVVFDEEERAALLPLPEERYELVTWKEAKVHRDSHISFERRLYSVPWPHIGEKVSVRATPDSVTIYSAEERLATHSRRGKGSRSTIEAHLPEHRGDLRHRSRAYWEDRAKRMGEVVLHYVREVFAADDVLSQLRTVQYAVTYLEKFPECRARAACERALYFGNLSYGGLKAILRKGLDLDPLPLDRPTRHRLSAPKYARRTEELLPFPGGVR
jgi:transposase